MTSPLPAFAAAAILAGSVTTAPPDVLSGATVVATPAPTPVPSPVPSPAPSTAWGPPSSPAAWGSPSPLASGAPSPTPIVVAPTPTPTPPGAPDGVLTARQIALHKQAAARLPILVEEAFAEIRRAVLAGERVSEATLVLFLQERLARDGLVAERRPIVSTGPNGSFPDHPGGSDQALRPGHVVLVDIAAKKKDDPDAVHARVTWTAFVGTKREIPARVDKVWKMVRDAREAAIETMQSRLAAGKPVTGEEIDAAARRPIRRAKHAPWFTHPAGESLGIGLVGTGPRLGAGETRALRPDTCWALRPAVYYPAEFGVRSESSVCVTGAGLEVTTGVRQREIRPLLD